MPKIKKGQAHVFSEEEFERTLKVISASTHAKRDTALVWMSFGTGLRVMELAALKINQVINDKFKIIERSTIIITKGGDPRPLILTNQVLKKAILDYLSHRKKISEETGAIFNFSQPLFLSQKGLGFTNKTLQQRFEKIYKNAGIEGASSHSGRRTFASNLADQGVDIKIIQVLMGHKSIAMTAKYIDHNPRRLAIAAEMAFNFGNKK